MALIDRIINISVNRVRDTAPTVGFGIPLFLGESLTTFPDIVKSYSSIEEVALDFTDQMPEYLAAKAVFSQESRVSSMLIGQKVDATSLLAAYNVAKTINPNFYAVGIESTDPADILAIAGQVETERRIFCVGSSQTSIIVGTNGNLFETLFNLGYNRTFGIWGENSATEFSELALASKMLSKVPGSANWRYQNLIGVTGDRLLDAEELTLDSYNANYYRFLASKNVTIGGAAFSGEWLDATHGLDWMTTSLEISLASLLVDVEKVPYTSRGDGLIRNAITSVLQLAADNEVINDDFTVTFSDIDAVPLSDKTARIRDGIEIFVTLSGAINTINIKFVVSD